MKTLWVGEKGEKREFEEKQFVTKNNKVPSMARSKLTTDKKEGLSHILANLG